MVWGQWGRFCPFGLNLSPGLTQGQRERGAGVQTGSQEAEKSKVAISLRRKLRDNRTWRVSGSELLDQHRPQPSP